MGYGGAAVFRDTLCLGWRVVRPQSWPSRRVVVEEVKQGALRLRIYASSSSRYPVVVLHGLTRQGFDDHRLSRFCRSLAATGFVVYTPDLSGLRGLDLDESDIERIVRTIRTAHERHGRKVGVMGFSVGATYGLIASAQPGAGQLVKYVLSAGAYYALDVIVANVFATRTREWYPVLAMDWMFLDRLGLTPAEEAMYRDIMDHYCLREGRFAEAEKRLIVDIVGRDAQAEVRRCWESLLPARSALQLHGNPYLRDIEAEVLLLCSRDDPLIPSSETARIHEALQDSNMWIHESAGHLDYQRGTGLGLYRLFSRVMTLRREASDA